MPDNAGQATQWGVVLASLLAACGGLLTAWLNRRSAVDTTRMTKEDQDEQRRQADLNRLYDGLWANVKALESKVASQDTTIAELREENTQCWADRAQLHNQATFHRDQIAAQNEQIATLRQRVAQLERP